MIDFYEGWNLRNRLIEDGFMTPNDDIQDGVKMMLRIADLAREHYNWAPAEPTISREPNDAYLRELETQTAYDRLNHIWDIAIDWDGYRTIRNLGGLLDEIIACAETKTKPVAQVIQELETFRAYGSHKEFLTSQSFPLVYAFPEEEFHNIFDWCEENDYDAEFLGNNYSDEGNIIACVFSIRKKEHINNDIVSQEGKE